MCAYAGSSSAQGFAGLRSSASLFRCSAMRPLQLGFRAFTSSMLGVPRARMIWYIWPQEEAPMKRDLPRSISAQTQPQDHQSTLVVYSTAPSTSSGARHQREQM